MYGWATSATLSSIHITKPSSHSLSLSSQTVMSSFQGAEVHCSALLQCSTPHQATAAPRSPLTAQKTAPLCHQLCCVQCAPQTSLHAAAGHSHRLLAAFRHPLQPLLLGCSPPEGSAAALLLLLVRASTPAPCALPHRLLEPGRAIPQGLLKL